jgi:hypothetical protein
MGMRPQPRPGWGRLFGPLATGVPRKGRSKLLTPVLNQRFFWSAITEAPVYPRPVGRRLEWAAPGHAAAPLGPFQTCSSGTLTTRTALDLLMLGKTAAACHFILAWSRTVGTLGFASISTTSVELLQATRPFGAPHGPETKQATYRLNWDTRSHELGHEALGLIDFVALCPTWDCTSSPHY